MIRPAISGIIVSLIVANCAQAEGPPRDGLLALYDFSSTDGATITDRAGIKPPIDLRITEPKAVRRTTGELEIIKPTLIRSEKEPARLTEAIKQSGAITIEVWLRPANTTQNGPARIVTFSRDPGARNFTLGQDGGKFDARLRTTKTGGNGIPSLSSKPNAVSGDWTHVVYVRERGGQARLYLNGKLNAEQNIAGETTNWDAGLQLALGNELSQDRPWLGALRRLAIYGRALSAKEIEECFHARPGVAAPDPKVAGHDASARLFETRVAPLISKHCLECHDRVTKEGGLDLSHRASALAGGKSGPALVAGKAAESRLWRRIESSEMPRKRPPLSAAERDWLKRWLDGPAVWSLETVDPAVYAMSEGAQTVFVQRLTVAEYIESVRSALGVDLSKEARELLPEDPRADGFSNTAYNLKVDLPHIEAYARLAELAAERLDAKTLATRSTKSRELTDENMTKVIVPLARRLLRGPLSKEEIAMYCGVSTSAAGTGGSFEEAIRYIAEAMLQSPRFLYRMENQRGDGSRRAAAPYELASRLSYILWGAPPDEELLKAAEKGKLGRAEVEAHARRMLKDKRAIERSRQFLSDWLELDRLDHLSPSKERFPGWDKRLAADMRAETLAYFEEVVWKQSRPLADLLNARLTFVTPRLAKHYGLSLDKAPANDELVRYDLSSTPGRGGLLTHASVLTIGGDEASMVARGLFVLRELLRGVVRDPPPCVDTTPVASKPGLAQRAIAEARVANKSCAGCHVRFEPLAFGLEKFDGLGAYHETDEFGNRLREDGHILPPGEEKPTAFQSTTELMNLLAKSERVRETLTWKVAQFALGRPLAADDAAQIADIHRRAQQGGGTYASLIVAIVTSDLVLTTATEHEK